MKLLRTLLLSAALASVPAVTSNFVEYNTIKNQLKQQEQEDKAWDELIKFECYFSNRCDHEPSMTAYWKACEIIRSNQGTMDPILHYGAKKAAWDYIWGEPD